MSASTAYSRRRCRAPPRRCRGLPGRPPAAPPRRTARPRHQPRPQPGLRQQRRRRPRRWSCRIRRPSMRRATRCELRPHVWRAHACAAAALLPSSATHAGLQPGPPHTVSNRCVLSTGRGRHNPARHGGWLPVQHVNTVRCHHL